MNFESSILKKETLSKTAAKEKESLIEDFSKLMEKCCTYPVQTDEELREVIRLFRMAYPSCRQSFILFLPEENIA